MNKHFQYMELDQQPFNVCEGNSLFKCQEFIDHITWK